MKTDLTVDTKGTACPMPVLNTKLALKKITSGQILEVIANDHGSEADIPVLVRKLGHELLEVSKEDGDFHFLIRKT